MKILLITLSIIFIISVMAPLSKREQWWIRGFDFPYVQFTVLGFFCVIEWSLIHQPYGWLEVFICGITFVLFIYRLSVIYPYTKLKRPSIPWSQDGNEKIRVVSANVLMSKNNYEGCMDVIETHDPDILFLVEVDAKWKNALNEKLGKTFPFQILKPLDNTYGMILYSKYKLTDSSIQFLVEKDVPSIHTKVELPDGDVIQFYGLHPKPPAPGENDVSTPRDAELVTVGKLAQKSKQPVIVAGDMNDVAWSHTTRLFMRVSGLLDPRMGRGFFNTFHAGRPLLRWPLDHFFFSHHFRIARLERLKNFHSDHYPILVDITLNPSVHALTSKEHATHEDLTEAREKLDKVDD
ncbi:endonuclease/exonuclease/phosphatase family protein [Ekhidna sp.]|uniref:endonuclease/exonuclease/phosphatase family protein n=1 Tax=Ekhidna sp. TaxID=2608089 RepID=UPI0032982ED7